MLQSSTAVSQSQGGHSTVKIQGGWLDSLGSEILVGKDISKILGVSVSNFIDSKLDLLLWLRQIIIFENNFVASQFLSS